MKMTMRKSIEGIAEALLADVCEAYHDGNNVEFFNALTRMKTGAEGLHKLACTAEFLDGMAGERE